MDSTLLTLDMSPLEYVARSFLWVEKNILSKQHFKNVV